MSPGDSNDRKPKKTRKPGARQHSPARRDQLTPAKRAKFLELTRQGKNRAEAAAAIGTTGTKIRPLLREGSLLYDGDFHAAYQEAAAEYAETRAAELDKIALDRIKNPDLCSDRALHNERIYRNPDYRAAHRQTGATVNVTTEMEVTHVHIEGAAERLRGRLAEVVSIDAARVASRAVEATTG